MLPAWSSLSGDSIVRYLARLNPTCTLRTWDSIRHPKMDVCEVLTKAKQAVNSHGISFLTMYPFYTISNHTLSLWYSGQACTTEDDSWFDFSSVTTFDERIANPLDPSAFSRRLYWEGPPAGVDIVLDDIK